jgi:hypothetical protein
MAHQARAHRSKSFAEKHLKMVPSPALFFTKIFLWFKFNADEP